MSWKDNFALIERRGEREREIKTADSLEELKEYIEAKSGSNAHGD